MSSEFTKALEPGEEDMRRKIHPVIRGGALALGLIILAYCWFGCGDMEGVDESGSVAAMAIRTSRRRRVRMGYASRRIKQGGGHYE